MRLAARLVLPLLILAALAGVATAAKPGAGTSLKLLANTPKVGTINSDLAFWGHLAFEGNYDGFRVIDIAKPRAPAVLADVRCHGPQNDVSVWGHLVFLSVDKPQTSPTCESQDALDPTDATAFEGIRIFDVADPRNPQFVAAVPTDCGSHTHTLVPDLAHGRVLLYVSSYPLIGGPQCGPGHAGNPLHAKISIVAVPLAEPATAGVIATPAIQAPIFNPNPGKLNPAVGCHDISVFLPLHLAAAACMSEGQLWNIADPANPRVLRHIRNGAIEFWHSATFSNDGKTVIFGDESLDSSCASENEADGRLWFYSVANPVKPLGSFLISPRRVDYCTVHMFNTIPVKGRSLLATSWYNGGNHVVDFSNPKHPRDVAGLVLGQADEWASYWYDGFVYASDIDRGLDVLSFSAPGLAGAKRLSHLNPQSQETLIG